LVESYLDGELEPSQLIEVENHTQGCATCRERIVLDRAIRVSVRHTVGASKPSDSFRARTAASMMAQRSAPPDLLRRATDRSTQTALPAWGGWLVAAAAAAAAVFGISNRKDAETAAHPLETTTQASVGLDAMLDQFVDWHARPLPPEITNQNDLPGFEPYVGVPVHPPALSPFGARWVGGRMLPVHEERNTAMLQYRLGSGSRVSVYVYDPRRIPSRVTRLQARMMDGEPDRVYLGHVRGWSIAAAERRGVGVAIASDLDDDESAELALAAARTQTAGFQASVGDRVTP
jgi:anti-sigma factor RsiW